MSTFPLTDDDTELSAFAKIEEKLNANENVDMYETLKYALNREYNGLLAYILQTNMKLGNHILWDTRNLATLISSACCPNKKSETNKEVFQMLIPRFKDNLEDKTNLGRTPLLHASFIGDIHLLSLLIDNNANIEATDKDRENALHLADTRETVIYILQRGGLKLLDNMNVFGRTPFAEHARVVLAGTFPVFLMINAPFLELNSRYSHRENIDVFREQINFNQTEDESHECRYSVYFSRSLVLRLFDELSRIDRMKPRHVPLRLNPYYYNHSDFLIK